MMNKMELDFEIRDTKKAIAELKLSGDYQAVQLAESDLVYLKTLK